MVNSDGLEIVPGVFLLEAPTHASVVRSALAEVPPTQTRSVYDVAGNTFVGIANPPAFFLIPSRTDLRFDTDDLLRMIHPEDLGVRVDALQRLRAMPHGASLSYALRYCVPNVGELRLSVVSRPLVWESCGVVRLAISDVTW